MGRPVKHLMVRISNLNDQVLPVLLTIDGTKGMVKLLPMLFGVPYVKLTLAKGKYFAINSVHSDFADNGKKKKTKGDQYGAGDKGGEKSDL